MKKLVAVLGFFAILGGGVYYAYADGCYMCEGGGYVRYRGSDTFAKRKEALKKCKCKVSGTTSSCSNPKCTVSVFGMDARPLLDRLNDRFALGLDVCDQ